MFHLLEDLSVKTKFLDQIKVKDTSHLINGISPNITKILQWNRKFNFFCISILSCFSYNTCFVLEKIHNL